MAKQHYTCQVCGVQFPSKTKDNKFCSVDCYRVHQKTPEYKAKITKARAKHRTPCTNCGKEVIGIKTQKRNGERADNKFCNRECYDDYRTKLQQEVIGQCQNCNKDILFGDFHRRDVVFCSMSCRKNHKRVKPTNCINCYVLFTPIAIHRKKDGSLRISGKSDAKTCSDECLNEFYRTDEARKEKISKAFTGSNHPNWLGGISHSSTNFRGSDWQKIRRQVLERDDYKCCHCGIDKDQQFERYGRDFSINHIIPFHQSGNTVKANKLSNLETLCDSCHTKADWKYRKENPIQGVLNFGRSA